MADLIVVLDQGSVKEAGSHEELIASNGLMQSSSGSKNAGIAEGRVLHR